MSTALDVAPPRRVAVLGAGPMGLMAALDMARAGWDVQIFERDDRIGGMSASFDFQGTRIERYYHFICKTDEPLFALLAELGLQDTLRWTATRMGYFYDGKLYKWGSPSALLSFPQLGWVDKFRYALHVMSTKRITDWSRLDGVRATEWLRRWVGPRAYEVLWRRAFELKFFEFTNDLSASWIGTRIKRIALSRKSLFEESLGYLEGGSATLLEAMDAELRRLGVKIHLKCGIEQVSISDGRVESVLAGGAEHPVDCVVSTAPIQYLPSLIPGLPKDYVEKISNIKNIPVACVILKLTRPLTENFWLNISDPTIAIPGLIEYSNLNPEGGHSIVYAPFYMPKTHQKWSQSNEALMAEVLAYLPRINPDFRPDWVTASHCHRYEFAQTICPPGFQHMLPPMATPVTGLFAADTAFYYPEDRSISESVKVGRKLAQLAVASTEA